jgi:predicted phage terminase large subunit-like protein
MAALQYVDVPGYAAILFRRTYQDLALPGALMSRAFEWLAGSGAHWSGQDRKWTFPSGATLSFGYLDTENTKYRYQSAEFQFVGFDELTQFPSSQYTYLFSRIRRLEGVEIPLRMRAGSNPGGIGHDWVKARFVLDHGVSGRVFVPAKLDDNPYLDRAEYMESLSELDAVTKAQLLDGNWDVLPQGRLFRREMFGDMLPVPPAFLTQWVRYWDKAGTTEEESADPDWSAGVLMGKAGRLYFVLDVVRGRWSPAARNTIMRQTTRADSKLYPNYEVWTEQEPGSGGKESALTTIAELAGYDVHAETVTGSKVVRANPFAAQCEVGNVKLVEGTWNAAYLNEVCAFPNGPHDDQVDASSGSFAKLAKRHYESGSVRYAR